MVGSRDAPRSSTLAGAVLGNYRVLEPLKRGGMGSVFRAEHAVLHRPAAIKVLRPELTTDEVLVRRFLDEAKAATQIRHPGIIEVYDYGTTPEGISYLVMELLEGQSLAARLAARGRLSEPEAAAIARGIASALKAAHRGGIVHRDLKPDNIFLIADPDGPTGERIKVLDFGIAKLIDPARAHHTQTGALIGTPVYMAPEQARAAHTIDHRADLYSLGCMLYEMVAGRPPFVAEGAGELIAMHLFNPPEPLGQVAAVSPELERIGMRLLEKEPDARFAHAGELLDALDAITGFAARAAAAAGGTPAFAAAGLESRPVAAVGAGIQLSLADERRDLPPPPRSSMGLVAALITVGIAAAVAIFILARGGGGGDGEAKPAAASGSDAGSAAAAQQTPGTPASPAPAKPTVTPIAPPKAAVTPAPIKPAPAAAAAAATAGVARPARPAAPVTPGRRPDPSGPVTKPDSSGPVTRPDSSGPVTSPGGSPYHETLEPKPAPAPAPAPTPPPAPPPAPSPDKLPDKPAEGA